MHDSLKQFVQKNALIIFAVLIAVAVIGWTYVAPAAQGPNNSVGEEVATTTMITASTTTTATIKTLPPEMPLVLPEGATKIDDYVFSDEGAIYFRSLTGGEALEIADADPASFKRLGGFLPFSNPSLIADCGAAPTYAFYTDQMRIFFYQVWRTPTFRSSRVEVIRTADKKTFEVGTIGTAQDEGYTYQIGYETTASSTCWLKLSGTEKKAL